MKTGWLLHDKLTCIPGTKTLWHNLLDWIPGLKNKCNDGELGDLPLHTSALLLDTKPDFVIRNATYWPWVDVGCPVLSVLQDIRHEKHLFNMQVDVCRKSAKVVAVSEYVASKYRSCIDTNIDIIPIGIDFSFFKPKETIQKKYDAIWIGDYNNYPKGFDILADIIKKTNYKFCIVLKSDYIICHDRVDCFNRVDHQTLVDLMQQSRCVLCTSRDETLHLASLEAGASNIPIITTNVGAYFNRESGVWGTNIKSFDYRDFIKALDVVLEQNNLASRDYLMKEFCMSFVKEKWIECVDNLYA
jgi:glycosyltransferase involved in cell wall biosynthesis